MSLALWLQPSLPFCLLPKTDFGIFKECYSAARISLVLQQRFQSAFGASAFYLFQSMHLCSRSTFSLRLCKYVHCFESQNQMQRSLDLKFLLMSLFNVKHRLLLNYAILKCAIITAHISGGSFLISKELQPFKNGRYTNICHAL